MIHRLNVILFSRHNGANFSQFYHFRLANFGFTMSVVMDIISEEVNIMSIPSRMLVTFTRNERIEIV